MAPRRLLKLLAALLLTVLLAGPLPLRAGEVSPPPEVGPIFAELVPPTTYYEVLNAESGQPEGWNYGVYWDDTTAGDPSPSDLSDPVEPAFGGSSFSCGDFYENADEDSAGLFYRENSAVWDHPNGQGDGFCPHEGTSHPGLVVAHVFASVGHPLLPTGVIPMSHTLCGYPGSETPPGGTNGPECDDATQAYDCYVGPLAIAILANTTAATLIQISATATAINVKLDNGESCSAPRDSLRSITIFGGNGNDHVKMGVKLLTFLRFGFNGGGGSNRLTLLGTKIRDIVRFQGLPPTSYLPAGMGIDGDSDGELDFGAIDVHRVDVMGRDGNDEMRIDPLGALYDRFLLKQLFFKLSGGTGIDKAVIRAAFAPLFYGTSIEASRQAAGGAVAQVNVNGDPDATVDVSGTTIERWTALGTAGDDVLSGAGGHGTGDAFGFPIKLSGVGGNDTLTGGRKADLLNGGTGENDICRGGRGVDEAKGCETVRSIP